MSKAVLQQEKSNIQEDEIRQFISSPPQNKKLDQLSKDNQDIKLRLDLNDQSIVQITRDNELYGSPVLRSQRTATVVQTNKLSPGQNKSLKNLKDDNNKIEKSPQKKLQRVGTQLKLIRDNENSKLIQADAFQGLHRIVTTDQQEYTNNPFFSHTPTISAGLLEQDSQNTGKMKKQNLFSIRSGQKKLETNSKRISNKNTKYPITLTHNPTITDPLPAALQVSEQILDKTQEIIFLGSTNEIKRRRQSRRGSYLKIKPQIIQQTSNQQIAINVNSETSSTHQIQNQNQVLSFTQNQNVLPTINQRITSAINVTNDNLVQPSQASITKTPHRPRVMTTEISIEQMLAQYHEEKIPILKEDNTQNYLFPASQDKQELFEKRQNHHLYGKINKHIFNLDVEEMNRNTRFFKDYLKDQIKESKKKSQKKVPDVNNLSGNLFQRKDSLTNNIQKESFVALRRLTARRDLSNKHQEKVNEKMVKQKLGKSLKRLFGNTKRKSSKISGISRVDDKNSGSDSSYHFTSSSMTDNGDNKIKRQSHHINKPTFGVVLEKEEDEINENQIRRINLIRANTILILYPDSNLRGLIDGISFILLLIISVYIPFVLAFNLDTSGPFDYFELFIDIWFLLEITVNFFTGYYDKGILIMNRIKIFKNYISAWFWIDLLSSSPILVIQILNQDLSNTYQGLRSTKLLRILRFARYARLLRLAKFLKLNKYLQPVEDFIVSDWANLIIRFLKISIGVVFITHWFACIIYSIGISEYEELGKNWLTINDLNDAGVGEQYVNSLYYAATTMCTVGYGDNHPVTTNERIIQMIIMCVSSGVFAYIIGNIGRMVSNFNVLADQFREKMIYIDNFLNQKNIPINLRIQVKRYLEYNWQLKKLYKIEEHDLLALLNENLRGKITVYFNAKILQNIDVLQKFPIDFLSNLSFILRKQTYIIDENMVIERENGNELFFVVNGRVSIIHKRTRTHFIDLEKDKYFGEISFFTELNRQATVKARDFTEVLILTREDFLQMALKVISTQALLMYHRIRESVQANEKDFKLLKIRCYICNTMGHIGLDCKQFPRFKGNLIRYFQKIYKESLDTNNESERKFKGPAASLESNQISPARAKHQKKHTMRLKNGLKQSTAIYSQTNLIESHQPHSFSNIVIFPREMQEQINNQIDNELMRDEVENLFKFNEPVRDKVFLKTAFVKREAQMKKSSDKSFKHISKANSIDTDSINELQNQQIESHIQFDTPPKDDHNSNNYISEEQKQFINFDKNIDDIIHEELLEEDEDETKKSVSSPSLRSSKPSSAKSYRDQQKTSRVHCDDDEMSQPLLHQSVTQQYPKAPKSQNELTKIIGQRKRFSSKNFRDQKKVDVTANLEPKRKIHIRPLQEIQQQVKTIVKKTYTTLVETITKQEEYKYQPMKPKEQKDSNNNQEQKGKADINQSSYGYRSRKPKLSLNRVQDNKSNDSFYMKMFSHENINQNKTSTTNHHSNQQANEIKTTEKKKDNILDSITDLIDSSRYNKFKNPKAAVSSKAIDNQLFNKLKSSDVRSELIISEAELSNNWPDLPLNYSPNNIHLTTNNDLFSPENTKKTNASPHHYSNASYNYQQNLSRPSSFNLDDSPKKNQNRGKQDSQQTKIPISTETKQEKVEMYQNQVYVNDLMNNYQLFQQTQNYNKESNSEKNKFQDPDEEEKLDQRFNNSPKKNQQQQEQQ